MKKIGRFACVVVPTSEHDSTFAVLEGLVERIEALERGRYLVDITPFVNDEHAKSVLLSSCTNARVGIANGRFTAEQAARTSVIVARGQERAFLEPLDVQLLPLSAEMERRLLLLGLKKLGDLAALPQAAVAYQFGRDALLLHEMARGRDPRSLRPDAPPLQLDRAMRFLDPTTHFQTLREQILRLTVETANELTQRGYQAESIRLTLHLEDLQVLASEHILKPPTADAARLCRAATNLLGMSIVRVPIAQIVVTAFPMRAWHLGVQQLSLFQTRDEARQRQLDEVIRQIRRRFGDQVILTASEIGEPKPKPVQVVPDRRGFPLVVRLSYGVRRVVDLIERWHEETGWEENERHRDYFQVALNGSGAVRTLFRNMVDGRWYLERITRLF